MNFVDVGNRVIYGDQIGTVIEKKLNESDEDGGEITVSLDSGGVVVLQEEDVDLYLVED